MNNHPNTRDQVRFWGPTTLAGAASAAAVAFLFAASVSAPVHAKPAVDHDSVPAVTVLEDDASTTQNCFIGRHNLNAAMGQLPQCTVAERTASYPE